MISPSDYPDDCLPLKKKVASPDEINRALKEISFLQSLNKSIDAQCKTEVDQVKERFQNQKTIKVSGCNLSLAERIDQLEHSITEYSLANKDELLAEESGKSRKFTHGAISWTKVSPTVDYRANENASTVLDRVEKKCGLAMKIIDFLRKISFGKIKLVHVVTLKPSFQITTVREAFKNQILDREALKSLGLLVTKESETFAIKPAKFELKMEQRTPQKAA